MNTGVKVADTMTRSLVTTTSTTTVSSLAKLMKEERLGGVIVMTEGNMEGIVTERDLVNKVLAPGKDPKETLVKDVMTKDIFTVGPDNDITDAMKLMNKNEVRRLPVVHDAKPVGIITIKDIIKVEPELIELILDKMELRETEEKPLRMNDKEGICNLCGNYAPVLYEQDSVMVCIDCRE